MATRVPYVQPRRPVAATPRPGVAPRPRAPRPTRAAVPKSARPTSTQAYKGGNSYQG